MRVFVMSACVAACVSSVVAQKPPLTPDDLDKAMKRAKPAMDAAAKAVQRKAFADATRQLGLVRQVMDDTQDFWIARKKEDAVKANRETVFRIEEVEKAFAASAVPTPEAGIAALKSIEAKCRVCHEKYRVRDADNNWVFKPGSL